VSQGKLTPQKRAEYQAALEWFRVIDQRHREAKSNGQKELHRIARWVLDQWEGENRKLLDFAP
jgi:hypothetical protein